jgi:hypothetical protein
MLHPARRSYAMRVPVLCLSLSLTLTLSAQTKKPAGKPATPARPAAAKPAAAPTAAAHFSAAGLNDEDDLLRIYSGDFQAIHLDRASTGFMLIISSYMNDYARDCRQFLPSNKVEITKQVCTQTSTPVNGYGNPVGASTCVSYETVGTGLYADPQLYAAEQDVDAQAAKKMLGGMLGMLTGKGGNGSNPLAMPQQMTDQLTAVGTEMQTLIHTNACGSPGLKNFQSNLIRFANGDDPVKYAGAVPSGPAPAPGGPAKEADFARLVNDLVADNARGWMMNRYQPGSISDPIVSRDPLGHPVRVIAQYSFTGMQGTERGRVTVSFKDGAPDCLYFSDAPDTCRLPAAGVVSAYEKNAYAK